MIKNGLTRLPSTLAAGMLIAGLGLVPNRAAAGVCIPGAQVACACPGGSSSVQVCLPDASGLGACKCELAPPVPVVPVIVPPVAPAPSAVGIPPVPPGSEQVPAQAVALVPIAPYATLRPAQPVAEETTAPSRLGTRKLIALVMGGVGVISLGVGTGIGIVALANRSSALSKCVGNVCPNLADANSVGSANDTGNVALPFLIVGGAGLAGGAVLWFTAPKTNRGPEMKVGLGPGSVRLSGSW
jgi:hypothetical protein